MKNSRIKRLALDLLLALLTLVAACSPVGQSGEADDSVRIGLSPAAHPVSAAVLSCASGVVTDEKRLIIQNDVLEFIELDSFDFTIQLGEADFAAEMIAALAEESLVIILHPSNPVRSLSQEQIAGLFSGRLSNWNLLDSNEAEVVLWIGPLDDETRGALESELLLDSPVSGNARLAASPQHMLEAVGADVNGIGILPAAWVDSSVRSLVSGLTLPVLAMAEGELSADARAILACLQGEKGQKILAETYSR